MDTRHSLTYLVLIVYLKDPAEVKLHIKLVSGHPLATLQELWQLKLIIYPFEFDREMFVFKT